MAIPEFYHFLKPVLEAMANGEAWSNAAVVEAVVPSMGFSEADLADRIPSGQRTRAVDRIMWALTYLRQAKLIETVTRGQNRITQRGRDYLKTAPTTIRPADLMRFQEFAEFQDRSKPEQESAGNGKQDTPQLHHRAVPKRHPASESPRRTASIMKHWSPICLPASRQCSQIGSRPLSSNS